MGSGQCFTAKVSRLYACFYGSPFVDNGIVFNPGDWELKTTDGTVRVIFQNQKIDYIEFGKKEYSREAIKTFASRCRDFFSEMLESRGLLSSRLAIAPSFVCEQPFREAKEILTSVYSENKLHFNDAEVDNCEFSQVLSLSLSLNLSYR